MPTIKYDADLSAELDEAGRLVIYQWLSDAGPLPNAVQAAAEYWVECLPIETGLQACFSVASILDGVIDMHENGKGGPLDEEGAKIIKALRTQFESQLERIAELRFDADA